MNQDTIDGVNGLYVSRLQELGLPLGEEMEIKKEEEDRTISLSSAKGNSTTTKTSLTRGRRPGYRPEFRPVFWGRWAGTRRVQPSGKQADKLLE